MACPPDTNPKTVFGQAKPGIHAIPPVALLHCGRGMEDGEVKYGLTNWREHEVSASVYYDAAFRHLAAWWDGEQYAADSGVHHLGHVMACCAILLDAEHMGALNDNRPAVPGPFARAVAEMTRAMTAGLCEDEGCEHHGTPHICITGDSFPSDANSSAIEEKATTGTGQNVETSDLSADQVLKKLKKLINGPEAGEKCRQRAVEFLDAEGVNKARDLPAHRLADMLAWVEMGDKSSDVTPAENAVVFDLIHDTGTLRDDRVTVVIRGDITATELDDLIAGFLRGRNRHGSLAVLNNCRTHIGSQNHALYSQNNRTRLAFYIQARMGGVTASLREMDEAIRQAGLDFGSA